MRQQCDVAFVGLGSACNCGAQLEFARDLAQRRVLVLQEVVGLRVREQRRQRLLCLVANALANDAELRQRVAEQLGDHVAQSARIRDHAPLGVDRWRKQVARRVECFGLQRAHPRRFLLVGLPRANRLQVCEQLLVELLVERERLVQHRVVCRERFAASLHDLGIAPVRLRRERDVAGRGLFERAAALALDEARDELRHAFDCEVHDRAFAQRVVSVVDRVGLEELPGLVGHHFGQRVAAGGLLDELIEAASRSGEALLQPFEELVAHRLAAARIDAVERRGDFLGQVADEVDVRVVGAIDDRKVTLEQRALSAGVGHGGKD